MLHTPHKELKCRKGSQTSLRTLAVARVKKAKSTAGRFVSCDRPFYTPTSPGTILLGKMAYHTKQIRRECIFWIWILLTLNFNFLGSEGLQETHMNALNQFSSKWMTLTLRGGLWTFWVNLALCAPATIIWIAGGGCTPLLSPSQ